MRRATAELIVKDPNKFAHHDRVFLNNPVVMKGMGLAPLVVLATSGQNAVMLAVAVALLLCAALLGCLLAACGGSESSPASSAAPASDSASASGSSELPSSTTEANTGELNPGNFDENSVFSITGTSNAFAPCLGWGPGVSGCSLKSVIAAASLLHWAEDARMSSRSPEAIQEAFYSWYDGLTDNQQEGFAEAWPLIKDAALDLLSDKDSMTGRIADAGLDADTLPGCTLKNWQALQTVLDDIVPETNGEA